MRIWPGWTVGIVMGGGRRVWERKKKLQANHEGAGSMKSPFSENGSTAWGEAPKTKKLKEGDGRDQNSLTESFGGGCNSKGELNLLTKRLRSRGEITLERQKQIGDKGGMGRWAFT